jgi:hypothetical protein
VENTAKAYSAQLHSLENLVHGLISERIIRVLAMNYAP